MSRPLRIEYPGAVYHVTSRGDARRPIFCDDKDRLLFLEVLASIVSRFHWLCHAYCLMNNHYHLIVETPEGNLSRGMRQLNGVYTQRFNRRHRKPGHVFQGRYKAIVVEKESYLLELCRYVVLNPVRAKAVETPEAWNWSSYRATAGSTDIPELSDSRLDTFALWKEAQGCAEALSGICAGWDSRRGDHGIISRGKSTWGMIRSSWK